MAAACAYLFPPAARNYKVRIVEKLSEDDMTALAAYAASLNP
jgi:cytochrome c553